MAKALVPRIFNWGSGGDVTDAIFSGGSHELGYGGAIDFYNEMAHAYEVSMTVSNADFLVNSARIGGAVDVYYGSMNITSALFSGNSGEQWGGAVYNEGGRMLLSSVTFSANSAAGANGGAVMIGSNGSMTVRSGAFVRNSATNGGAFYNYYGILGAASANLILSDAVFVSNSAETGGAVENYVGSLHVESAVFSGNSAVTGGAIYNYFALMQTADNMTVSDTVFTSNSATNGGAVENYMASAAFRGSNVFSGNFAEAGGAWNNISGTLDAAGTASFSSNSAAQTGGAVRNSSGTVSFQSAVFSGNSAQWGGAVFNDHADLNVSGGVLFQSNSAAQTGGALQFAGGGGIMTAPVFSGNHAVYGGAVYYSGGNLSMNLAVFSANSALQTGGAIQNENGTLNLSSASFAENSANSGGALLNRGETLFTGSTVMTRNSAGLGGAVYNLESLALSSATLDSNTAAWHGGAVLNADSMSLVSAHLHANAAQNGGAVYNQSALLLSSAAFDSNTAAAMGGGLYNTGAVSASDIIFSGNAAGWGGAVLNTGSMTVRNAAFLGNRASSDGTGGGILNSGTIVLESASFSGNTAGWGGAVHNAAGGSMTLRDASFLTSGDVILNEGTLTLSGANAIAAALNNYGTLDLDISGALRDDAGIISDLSRLNSTGTIRVTVADLQYDGAYTLAEGADGFSSTVSVRVKNGETLGSLTVGDSVMRGDASYTLRLEGSNLYMDISGLASGDVFPPAMTSGVTVSVTGKTAVFSWEAGTDDTGVTGYRLDVGGTVYETPELTYSLNDLAYGEYTCRCQAVDAAGNASEWTADEAFVILPETPSISVSTTVPVNTDVTVTLSASDTTLGFEVSSDGTEWTACGSSYVVSSNAVLYFRCASGPYHSDAVTCTISNIDRDAGTIIMSADNTVSPMERVTLAIGYPADAVTTLWSDDGGATWQEYTGALTVVSNGIIRAKSTDSAGNIASAQIEIGNIASFASGVTDLPKTDSRYVQYTGSGAISGRVYSGFSNVTGAAAYCEAQNLTIGSAAFVGNTAADLGGALFFGSGVLELSDAVFSGNTGTWGGNIHVHSAAVTASGLKFYGNTAAEAGAGYYQDLGSFTGGNMIFSGNTVAKNGAGFYNSLGSAALTNVTFIDNTASNADTGCGGGLFNSYGVIRVSSAYFLGNIASWGGGLNNDYGSAWIYDNVYSGNSALGYGRGGGLNNFGYLSGGTLVFSSNVGRWGGAVYNSNGFMELENAVFRSNYGSDCGGGIYNLIHSCSVSNAVFSGNWAQWGGAVNNTSGGTMIITGADFIANHGAGTGKGGAVWNESAGLILLSSVTFTDNSAGYGAAVCNDAGRIVISDAVFSGNSASWNAAVLNEEGAFMDIRNASFLTETDTIYNAGTMSLAGSNILNAALNNAGSLILDLANTAPDAGAVISDGSLVSGSGTISVSVSAAQTSGTYVLAENIPSFGTITIRVDGTSDYAELAADDSWVYGDTTFTLNYASSTLSLTVLAPDPVETDTRTNFLENGVSQVLAWDAMQGKVGFMATDGNPSPAWRGVWEWSTEYNPGLGASESELWKVVGAGHFAGSTVDYDGILLYNGIGNTFAAWTDLNDPSYGYASLCHVDGNFQTKCLADFDGNGFDDVIIYDEKGSVGIVSDAAAYHDVWHVEGDSTEWSLLGAGTFDTSLGQDSILFRNTANSHLYLWDNQGSDIGTWNWRQTNIGWLADGWEFAAIGDFAGDGIDDIVLVNRNDNDAVFVWDDGDQSTQHYVGILGEGFKIETVGDYDGDGKEDLLLREYKSGWGGIGCWSGADANKWTDFNARIETDMESRFAIIA